MCYKNNITDRRVPHRRLTTMLVALAVATPSAQNSAVSRAPTQPRAAEFVERLRQAVDAGDRRAVAALVEYPLTVLASGFNIPVKDIATFVTITPDGLTLADGAIWAPLKDGRYRIARIRVPPAAPSVEGRKGVEHVTFSSDKGGRTASYAGWLVRRNVDAYSVALKKGETIVARIEGFRGHDATVRVAAVSRGVRPSLPPATDIGRTSSATAAADSEYRVEVAHIAPYCDPPQRYKLTVTVH